MLGIYEAVKANSRADGELANAKNGSKPYSDTHRYTLSPARKAKCRAKEARFIHGRAPHCNLEALLSNIAAASWMNS
jgi:hypothetical protein